MRVASARFLTLSAAVVAAAIVGTMTATGAFAEEKPRSVNHSSPSTPQGHSGKAADTSRSHSKPASGKPGPDKVPQIPAIPEIKG
jgi:hypothetical protein